MQFSPLSCMLHVPPTSTSLVWSNKCYFLKSAKKEVTQLTIVKIFEWSIRLYISNELFANLHFCIVLTFIHCRYKLSSSFIFSCPFCAWILWQKSTLKFVADRHTCLLFTKLIKIIGIYYFPCISLNMRHVEKYFKLNLYILITLVYIFCEHTSFLYDGPFLRKLIKFWVLVKRLWNKFAPEI
jgi:hypothetical protein